MGNINSFFIHFLIISAFVSFTTGLFILLFTFSKKKYDEKNTYRVWLFLYFGFCMAFIPVMPWSGIFQRADIFVEMKGSFQQVGALPWQEAENGMLDFGQYIVPSLFSIWIAGVVVKLMITVKRKYSFLEYIKKLEDAERNKEVVRCFHQIKQDMKMKEDVGLKVIKGLDTPLVYFQKIPIILLPQGVFSYEELCVIFSHEFAHIKRKDMFWNMMKGFCEVTQWFNPLMPLLGKKFDLSREVLCDAYAVKMIYGKERWKYAEILVNLSRRMHAERKKVIWECDLGSQSKVGLRRRIEKLLEEEKAKAFCPIPVVVFIVLLSCNELTTTLLQNRNMGNQFSEEVLREMDGDVNRYFALEKGKDLCIENEGNAPIYWVVAAQKNGEKKEKAQSNVLAQTLDGVIGSGWMEAGGEENIALPRGQYGFYAYCENEETIAVKLTGKKQENGF
ncbi:M56 family metallopeptidase [Anaerotignum sp.]|uniref:M56 family metallopeptidase n=1 Tax=Anaerotignum sp. TaxID=2039241 RepID=UPI002A912FCD|nr:M56 family metallopeptidase [Anaerotignum sp.]MCI7657329.1 M56 family metallopeptidase [Clostridia bacterium]MDY5414384.1 M56 family metallopeptidase [Anaerotignum sp.]